MLSSKAADFLQSTLRGRTFCLSPNNQMKEVSVYGPENDAFIYLHHFSPRSLINISAF